MSAKKTIPLEDKGLPLLRAFCDEHGSDRILGLINDLIADDIISPDYCLTPTPDETRASAA